MRLWTVHPRHLDARGLVALWREALLAQAVLRGRTRGYKAHPQLARFKAQKDPVGAIATYLHAVHAEAVSRGYTFDAGKIARPCQSCLRLRETDAQIAREWTHLKRKLRARSSEDYRRALRHQRSAVAPSPHPLFVIVPGPVAEWEAARA